MFDVGKGIDPQDFLASFIASEAGQSVIARREADRLQDRRNLAQQAAEAEADRDKLVALIDEDLDKAHQEVTDLTAQLKTAQAKRAELQARRAGALQRCHAIVHPSRQALAATMPAALRDLIDFAGYLEAAATGMQFRASRPTTVLVGQSVADRSFDWSGLRNRADRVRQEASALIMQPDTPVSRFAELEAELQPIPAGYRSAWLDGKGQRI